ncbi:MAG: DUF6134 family protein [Alphaproteobacteria bacterium]
MTKNLRLLVLVPFAAMTFAAGSAARANVPYGTYKYVINHPLYGDIGTFTNTISRDGGEVVVDTRLRVAVRLLFIVVYRLEADRREVWRDGRLAAYDSLTNDNGTDVRVAGRAEGEKFIIEGPQGRIEAPAGVHPSNPWSIGITRAGAVMAAETGRLPRVTVTGGEARTVKVGGREVKARRFRVTGDMELEIWFDRNDVAVRFAYASGGDRLVFTLQ